MILDADVLRIPPSDAMVVALEAGVRFFQYRDKGASRRKIYEISLRLASMARAAGALFIINDHADIAAAVEADGVHLGQDDFPAELARKLLGAKKVIGVSTHGVEQARDAQAAGADYIGFGPLFPTATKDAGSVQGTGALTSVKKAVSIPVIAIGGITQANAGDVVRAGADGVAVISAVLSAPDMKLAAQDMIAAIRN